MRAAVLAIMSLTLLASTQDSTVPTLLNTTDLSDMPGEGRRLGVLLAGAPVRVLERDGTWVKVSIEGWVEANDLGAASAAALPAGGGRGRISGSIFISEEDGATTVGSAIGVRLLRDGEGFRASVDSMRAACDSRREEIAGEIEVLKKEGDSAMRTEDTSEAFRQYDEIKRRRLGAQKALASHDRECAERVETLVESHTVSRTLTSADGRYELPAVQPGRYVLHVALDSGDNRHEWDVEVSIGPGEELTLDLTEDNRTRRAPIYR